MATLSLEGIAPLAQDFVKWSGNRGVTWPLVGGAVVTGWLLAQYGGALAGINPSEAVTVIGALGGILGFAMQTVASQLLPQLDRPVNVLEIAIPSLIVAGIGSAALYALLPPNNQTIYRFLQAANLA